MPREGEKLGQALAQSLGNSYGQPIHFIGHSLGTLVNAAAANYLHENTGGTFSPQNTHITLLDDAALANIEGTFVQLGYTLTAFMRRMKWAVFSTAVGFPQFRAPRFAGWIITSAWSVVITSKL